MNDTCNFFSGNVCKKLKFSIVLVYGVGPWSGPWSTGVWLI